jgi:CheY-like chemotaxis protein
MSHYYSADVLEMISGTHVLVVEDETLFREAIVKDFLRRGFKVTSAENGKIAMDMLQNSVVHVVISDIRMPGGNGIELLEYIKRNNPTLPIVMMMTGFAELSSEDAQGKGADALFSKPFDGRLMIEAVMKLVMKYNEEINIFASSVRTDLKIQLSFNHAEKKLDTQAINISPKGLFVSVSENFPQISDEVNFDLEIGGGSHIQGGRAIVKWVSFKSQSGIPSGVGIEFFQFSDSNKEKISTLIKSVHERSEKRVTQVTE